MDATLVIVLLLCASAAIFGVYIAQNGYAVLRERRSVERRLASFASEDAAHFWPESGATEGLLLKLARLSLLISGKRNAQARLVREGGFFSHGAVTRFLALRLGLAIFGLMLGVSTGAIAGRTAVEMGALTIGLMLAGYFGPVFVLIRRRRLRRKRVFREMPLFLDSVKLILQSGASVELTLRQIARMDAGAMPEIRRTLVYLLEDLDQGRSYDVAFSRWIEKLAIPEAEEVAGLMLQSTRHGTELTPPLEQFIQDQIQRRFAVARETAGKRSVSLTVVMVAFFLPPLVAIIVAPAAIDIVRNIVK